ncbi:hypothetical protein AB0M28_14735 [Streptomyces sp. NPDC051940]|uniref:hypothetical protein n=1 Tax=Streptomyces sp. NPDC051940 TaxID=3155675 RepID=UPI00343388BE
MALLGRRRSADRGDRGRTGRWGARLSRPAVDPDFGDPRLPALRAAATSGDWPALRDGLASVDDEDRTWLLSRLTEVPGVEVWIREAVAAEPDSALALLVAGARQVAWAWEARTGARASQVSEDQFRVFHERLCQAEEWLYEVAEREPGWLAPWLWLQTSGRGLEIDTGAARRRFAAAVRRGPGNLLVHQQHLQQIAAKWGGSHEEMHAFARRSMLAAPEGSPLGELVALGHIEEWLDRDETANDYIRRPKVVAELHEAARRSVLHPDFRRTREWMLPYNTFAMAFSLAGEHGAARPLFAALDGAVTEFPWFYLADGPERAFRKHRDQALS